MTERRRPAPKRAAAASKRPASRKPARKRSLLWRHRRGLFLAGLVLIAGSGGLAAIALRLALPPVDALLQTSFVCAADVTEACGPDNAIATFSAEEDRINVPLADLPDVLVQAVLAAEDRDFYAHGGVDPAGIARALYRDIRGSGAVQGGSTITQQYVKNAYLTSERSISRKVKEAVLAVKLEQRLDKDQILERYLNTIYFGRGAYGVGAASRAYFGKDVRSIGIQEASYLAGLIRSPGPADAQDDPKEATRRRATVLEAMRSEKLITKEEAARVGALGWDYVIPRRDRRELQLREDWRGIGAEYFIEAVRIDIATRYGEDKLYGGGLRIYTSLDHRMQQAAWRAVTSTLTEPDDPAAALVALDEFGQVKAMIGGRDITTQHVNLALGKQGGGSGRQAGSAFKPFVLAEAMQQGISLSSRFQAPGTLVLPRANAGKDWKVSNYGGTEQGVLDLVSATRVSSNTAYAQLMLEVGPDAVVELADRMGITADLPNVNSLVLGTGEVSVLDMASGFSTFANRGVHNKPTLIQKIDEAHEDGSGVSNVEQVLPSGDVVLTQQEADLVTYCLRQVVAAGTGKAANIGETVAGKTGTTQDNRDAWFVGFTPKLTAAVWMGYVGAPGAEVRFMSSVHGRAVTGGSFPAEIWAKFMREATKGLDPGKLTTPTSFPGRPLNPELQLPTSSTSSTSSTTGSTTTTKPKTTTTKPTSTTAPTTTESTTPSTTPSTGPPN
ncbi:MAG: transglycosylase domain-containing protein [Microthrixaceae bacterium]